MTAEEDAYVLWNYRLEDQFLLADSHDGAVQLAITPYTLARAITATDGGEWSPQQAEKSFVEAVAAYYSTTVLRSPRKLRSLTTTDAGEVPLATSFLALSVLAAFHMHTDVDHSALAFYPRLAKMLGCGSAGGYPKGFEPGAFLDLWGELDQWLKVRHGRRLAQPDPNTSKRIIAQPFAHVRLREVDLERLPQFFETHGYEPGDRVLMERLAYDLVDGTGAWRGLTQTGQKALEDPYRRAFVVRQVAQELERWDGFRTDTTGRRIASIKVWMDIRRRRAQLHLLAQRPEGFPDELGNGEIVFVSSQEGWYEPIPLGAHDGRILRDGVRIDKANGQYGLQLRRGDVLPLTPSEQYSGFVSDRVLRADTPCAVLCHETMVDRVEDHLETLTNERNHARRDNTLPEGWCLFTNVRAANTTPPPYGMERLNVESSTSVVTEGGLHLGRRWRWLEGAPARVRVVGSRHSVTVKINGKETDLDADGFLPTTSMRTQGEYVIEIGNRLRRKAKVDAASVHPDCIAWPEPGESRLPIALPHGDWTVVGATPPECQAVRGGETGDLARPTFKAEWAIRVGARPGATAIHLHDPHEAVASGKGTLAESPRRARRLTPEGNSARWAETIYQAAIRKPRLVCDHGCSTEELSVTWRDLTKRARAHKRAMRKRHR